MNNTINGRTPEEIKKGLECCLVCRDYRDCLICPYGKPKKRGTLPCECEVKQDILALINQLLEDKKQYKRERDQYKRERDAAVETLCKTDEILLKHGWTGTHGCINEVRKTINDGLIGIICSREAKTDEQIRT